MIFASIFLNFFKFFQKNLVFSAQHPIFNLAGADISLLGPAGGKGKSQEKGPWIAGNLAHGIQKLLFGRLFWFFFAWFYAYGSDTVNVNKWFCAGIFHVVDRMRRYIAYLPFADLEWVFFAD